MEDHYTMEQIRIAFYDWAMKNEHDRGTALVLVYSMAERSWNEFKKHLEDKEE